MDYFLNTLIPYFNEYTTLEKLEKKINAPGNLPNNNQLATVLKYGLILAKVVKNPNYEILKQKYRELLKEWSDWDKQELEKVISYLDSHPYCKVYSGLARYS